MSMAMKYALQKRAKMARGGEARCSIHDMSGCGMCMAEGGEAEDDDSDLVGRIMSARSRDDTPPLADSEENDFDVLGDKEPEADMPGSDEIGDPEHDEEDRDMVMRIMRSRAKKDRMPRPA